MLNWSQIAPALKSLFSDLAFPAASPTFEAQWHDRNQQFTHQGTQTDLLLQVTNIRTPPGEDDRAFEMVKVNGDTVLADKLSGHRLITLNVRVESLDQSDTLWAWATIERIRARLDRLSTHERLRSANMALVRTMAAVNLPTPRDGRIMSVASMDVLLAAGSEDVDLSGATSWIERIHITPAVKDTDGETLPPAINKPFLVDASD